MVEVADVLEVLLLRLGRVPYGEGQDGAQRAGLLEDRPAVRQLHGVAVTEAAYAAQGAEVVVEGPVLLHEDDDVPDRFQSAGGRFGGYRRPQRGRKQRSGRGGADGACAQREHPSARNVR
ncbi:hypothetical protein GCM10009730_21960 [Streptomyces albidochromogenes]